MSQWNTLKERAAGRWQLPLLAVSLIMLITSFLRLNPAPTELPLEEAIEHLDKLIAAEFYGQARGLADVLLSRSEYTHNQRAEVELRSARARFGYAQSALGRRDEEGRSIVRHYRTAMSHSLPLLAEDYVRLGRAYEWQDLYEKAIGPYDTALEMGVSHAIELRRRKLALMIDRLDTPAQTLGPLLDRFAADSQKTRLDMTLWALEQRLGVFGQLNDFDPADGLLSTYRDAFQGSDLQDRFAFLEAWVLYRTDRFAEAERFLRVVRNRVEADDPVFAMTGWLLGRVVAVDDGPQRPQEALSFYSSVVRHQADTPFGVASRIGMAEALVTLERHTQAVEAYRTAIDNLIALGELPASETLPGLVSRDVLRASLGVMSDVQRMAGRLEQAVSYAELAVSLTDASDAAQSTRFLQQLGQAQVLLATQLDSGSTDRVTMTDDVVEASTQRSKRLFTEAANTYLRLARINAMNERLAAKSSWRAAELYARSGARDRAAKLFSTFAAERPLHARVPQALLRVGQLRQALGQLSEAVEAYQTCYRRHPRSLAGARGLVPMARCYLAMGPDFEDLAEKTLRIVLEESEVFTPHAPEFADALFLLGDALNRRGDYERAIATLEEVLTRYPDDPRSTRARFLLADSSLKSGLALKAELATAKYQGEIEQIRAESTARFEAARHGFHQIIQEYASRDQDSLSELEQVYRRHAYLYEADCLFEMQAYERALQGYEEAVGMYKETPSALAAYVQIINSHVFLDQPEEARAALARALVLVDTITDGAFAQSPSPEHREDWRRYFQWLGQSGLF